MKNEMDVTGTSLLIPSPQSNHVALAKLLRTPTSTTTWRKSLHYVQSLSFPSNLSQPVHSQVAALAPQWLSARTAKSIYLAVEKDGILVRASLTIHANRRTLGNDYQQLVRSINPNPLSTNSQRTRTDRSVYHPGGRGAGGRTANMTAQDTRY